jgi:hypothetical protein
MSEPGAVGTTGTTATAGTTAIGATAIAAPSIARTTEPGAVGTGGSVTMPPSAPTTTPNTSAVRPQRTRVESIPRPTGSRGVWLDYNGARWYSAGASVPFEASRFVQIGEYRGFPVYRDNTGPKDQIWIMVVKDGPVAPYRQ